MQVSQLGWTNLVLDFSARLDSLRHSRSLSILQKRCVRSKYHKLVLKSLSRVMPKKNERGSIPSPFQQNPIFTPSLKLLGHHHPGKIKNHLPASSASALPRMGNTCPELEPLIQQGLAAAVSTGYANPRHKIYSFSQYWRGQLQSSGDFMLQWPSGWPRQGFRTIVRHLLRFRLRP